MGGYRPPPFGLCNFSAPCSANKPTSRSASGIATLVGTPNCHDTQNSETWDQKVWMERGRQFQMAGPSMSQDRFLRLTQPFRGHL